MADSTCRSQSLPIQEILYQIMKAFIFARTGEPSEVLSLQDIAQPTPGPGEVLVRIRFSPVHPTDLHVQRGRFGRQPELPASPGNECVGVILLSWLPTQERGLPRKGAASIQYTKRDVEVGERQASARRIFCRQDCLVEIPSQ
jgi:hypothetical protein